MSLSNRFEDLRNSRTTEEGEFPFRTPLELAKADWHGYQTPPHIQLINKKAMQLVNDEFNKLSVFMPPRHGKSEYLSKYFLAWYICKNPDDNIIFITYSASLAEKWGLEVRELIDEFGGHIKIKQDQRKKGYFKIDGHRGSCTFTGVSGSITGKGAQILIIDDPIKDAVEANSPAYRERAVQFYQRTARTRLEPNGKILLIQTRWHVEDLGGYILENEDDWEVLRLPAIAEEGDLLKRTPGASLWSERYGLDALNSIKKDIGTIAFQNLYQNKPILEGGNEMSVDWIRTFPEPPRDFWLTTVAAIDPAISEKETADNSVITVGSMGRDQKMYIRMHRGGKWGFTRQIEEIKTVNEMYHPQVFLIETVAYQKALKDYLMDNTLIPVKELERKRISKEMHIRSMSPNIENGQVLFYDGLDEQFLKEYVEFPQGAHDDYLDSTEMVVSYLRKFGGVSPYTDDSDAYYYDFSTKVQRYDNGNPDRLRRRPKTTGGNPYSSARITKKMLKDIFRV